MVLWKKTHGCKPNMFGFVVLHHICVIHSWFFYLHVEELKPQQCGKTQCGWVMDYYAQIYSFHNINLLFVWQRWGGRLFFKIYFKFMLCNLWKALNGFLKTKGSCFITKIAFRSKFALKQQQHCMLLTVMFTQ